MWVANSRKSSGSLAKIQKGYKMGKGLVGKKEITAYVRRSWMTIQRWIIEDSFPARKIDGVWESDTTLVDEWKRAKIKPCQ